VTTVYKSDDGTVYDSTDGWRIESYGSDKVPRQGQSSDFDRLARRNRTPCASRREDEGSVGSAGA
jgi:hypothetical protein